MCRHTAYLGPPATLASLLIDPPHSLYRQAWAPRRQRHGTVNADGFGVGWYADGDPVPARYRRGGAFGVSPVACRGTFRNWDYPIRRQIFAGFRTARSASGGPASGRPATEPA